MTQWMLIAALAAPTTRRPWLRRRRHAGRIGLSRTMADLPGNAWARTRAEADRT